MKIIKSILLILNMLVVIGLVLTTLAGDIAPSRSVLPSVLAYAYLPMLGLNVLFALGWMLARKWPFLISVAAIVVRWSFVGLFFQVGGTSKVPPAEGHPDMVTLMTYNLHNFVGAEYTTKRSDSVARAFLAFVREQPADVLCLQEFTNLKKVRLTDSLELMGYNHHYGARGKVDNPRGTVVFSRHPITYVKRLDSQKVLVELLCGERTLRLCCVHMDSYSFTEADREELEQMSRGKVDSTSQRTFRKAKQTVIKHETEWSELLKPVVEECSVPLVVAGDMNDIPGSWLYWRMSDHLTDTYRECGQGFGLTYHGGTPKFRIDMVFHSDQLRALSYKRFRTKISDHYPVMVSLEFANP